jgi:hypothetical protein
MLKNKLLNYEILKQFAIKNIYYNKIIKKSLNTMSMSENALLVNQVGLNPWIKSVIFQEYCGLSPTLADDLATGQCRLSKTSACYGTASEKEKEKLVKEPGEKDKQLTETYF